MPKVGPINYHKMGSHINMDENILLKGRFSSILNRDNMRALNDYMRHNKLDLFISEQNYAGHHSLGSAPAASVCFKFAKHGAAEPRNGYNLWVQLSDNKSRFAETVRNMYKQVEGAINTFAKK